MSEHFTYCDWQVDPSRKQDVNIEDYKQQNIHIYTVKGPFTVIS